MKDIQTIYGWLSHTIQKLGYNNVSHCCLSTMTILKKFDFESLAYYNVFQHIIFIFPLNQFFFSMRPELRRANKQVNQININNKIYKTPLDTIGHHWNRLAITHRLKASFNRLWGLVGLGMKCPYYHYWGFFWYSVLNFRSSINAHQSYEAKGRALWLAWFASTTAPGGVWGGRGAPVIREKLNHCAMA